MMPGRQKRRLMRADGDGGHLMGVLDKVDGGFNSLQKQKLFV